MEIDEKIEVSLHSPSNLCVCSLVHIASVNKHSKKKYVIDARLLELLGLTSGGMPEEKTVTCASHIHVCFAHSLVLHTFTCVTFTCASHIHWCFFSRGPFSRVSQNLPLFRGYYGQVSKPY